MKINYANRALPIFILIAFHLFSVAAQETTIQEIQFTQGKIIGDLPYGQHFYLTGSTKLEHGGNAEKVKVEIWTTGREIPSRRKKTLPELDSTAIKLIRSNRKNLINSSEWFAYRADDAEVFKVYINSLLKFQTEYFIEFTYSKVFTIQFSNEEKEAILEEVLTESGEYFRQNDQITDVVVGNILRKKLSAALFKKVDEGEETYYDPNQINENLPLIMPASLKELSDIIPAISASQLIIEKNNEQIKSLQQKMEEAEDDNAIASLQRAVNAKQQQIEREQRNLMESTQLREKLLVIKKQMVVAGKEYTVSSPNATSIPEVKSIRVGTTFGAGAVGLNIPDQNARDYDSFGYSALKYYLAPVDKRISNPYLTDKVIINRMSVMVGFTTKEDFNYRGAKLNKALAVTPLLGFSYDVNRYCTIDLGMTTFKQSSLSPLSEQERLRVGPVLGVNLDADIFNRVNTLVSGDPYKINPALNE